MHLKSIELCGFKSFADRVRIDFTDGITAIVGPNGSGKSNISDAFRWCLGEQSPRSLRGTNMQDVIFNGTARRRAMHYAEVVLTFDNSDKTLDMDEHITVRRKVYRSGESEYMLNGVPCRLKDIQEAFMDTGLGSGGYAIIGQGRLTELLTKKPEDRRGILEHAAGISKYRMRREEALSRLAATNENIVRLDDIISELEARLEPLANQSEKAQAYIALRDQLKSADVTLFMHTLSALDAQLADHAQSLSTLTVDVREAQSQEDALRQRATDLRASLQDGKAALDALSEARLSLTKRITATEGERNVIHNNAQHAESDIKRIEGEIAHMTEQRASLSDEIVLLRDHSRDDAEKLLRETLERRQSELRAVERQHADVVARLDALDGERMSCYAEQSRITGELSAARTLDDNYAGRLERIESELSDAQARLDTARQSIDAADEKLRIADGDIQAAQDEMSDSTSAVETLRAQLKQCGDAFNAAVSAERQCGDRVRILREMEREGLHHSVKTILSASRKGQLDGVYGTVGSLLHTDPAYATAIEVALGGAVQYIVALDESHAKAAVAYLKQHKAGRATFIVMNSVKPSHAPEASTERQRGYIGTAQSLVRYDDALEDVVSSLLGRVIVMDDMDHAIQLSKAYQYRYRVVTQGGELFAPGGLITGGSAGKSSGIISRTAKLDALTAELERCTADVADKRAAYDSAAAQLEASEQALSAYNGRIATLTDKRNAATLDRQLAAQIMHNAERTMQMLVDERAELVDAHGGIRDRVAHGEHALARIADELSAIDENRAASKRDEQGILKQADKAREHAHRAEVALVEHLRDTENLNSRVAALEQRVADTDAGVAYRHGLLDDLRRSIAEYADEQARCTLEIQRMQAELADNDATAADTAARCRDDEAALSACEQAYGTAERTHKGLLAEQSRVGGIVQRLEIERDMQVNKLWEEYELTPPYTSAYALPDVSHEQAKALSAQLREEIRALGNVNLDAIAEYDNLRERVAFMNGQRDDLNEGKAKLERIIDDITARMREQFNAQFAVINTHFNTIFAELFGGGQAKLTLTDGDVLSGGVEIDVCPPGKQLRSISLLSGGEQSLSAIALLFAILEVRPAPFYILDEIEAALDDVNVARFADFLRRMCEKSQLILITHRRGTMEAAHTLHGVTMQQRGVTEIVTFNMNEFFKDVV